MIPLLGLKKIQITYRSCERMINVNSGIAIPLWATYLQRIGKALSEVPTVEYGNHALRVVLSVPTGRFTYWMLTSGALDFEPDHLQSFGHGDRVACWVDRRMQDVILTDAGDEVWELFPGAKFLKDRFIAVKVPNETPDARRSAVLETDFRTRLSNVPGRKQDYSTWFARHCLKPVVIIGTGREHIQQQRRTLLDQVPDWFSTDTHALLTNDTGMTSNPERMLHHPFMVFDADVGASRPWLRQMIPRLVIVTSWSSQKRMHDSLFSRAPRMIVTNRRVRSTSAAEIELKDLPQHSEVRDLLEQGRPQGIGLQVYTEVAQGEFNGDSEDEFEGLM